MMDSSSAWQSDAKKTRGGVRELNASSQIHNLEPYH
jgi:hypothetical protein